MKIALKNIFAVPLTIAIVFGFIFVQGCDEVLNTSDPEPESIDEVMTDTYNDIKTMMLEEATDRGHDVYDDNLIIGIHNDASFSALAFKFPQNTIDIPLIFFYYQGKSSDKIPDGFYTINGTVTADGFDPAGLTLVNSAGVRVMDVTLETGDNPGDPVDRTRLTDLHIGSWYLKISGVLFGDYYELTLDYRD